MFIIAEGGGGASITVNQLPVEKNTDYRIVVGTAKVNSSFGKGTIAYFTTLSCSTPSISKYTGGGDVHCGSSSISKGSKVSGGAGASGIVIIRNKR